MLAEWLVEQARSGRLGATSDLDLAAVVAKDPGPPPACLHARVLGGDHHPGDPGGEDRVCAGRRAALVGAGLERDEHRRSREVLAARASVRDRRDLGVVTAKLGVPALADHLPAAGDHGADERVRTDLPASALGKLQSATQMSPILLSLGFGRRHRTD
jgi:hypothetical protein